MARRSASVPARQQSRKKKQSKPEFAKHAQGLAKLEKNLSQSAVQPAGNITAPGETLPTDEAVSTHTRVFPSENLAILRPVGKVMIDVLYHTDLDANMKKSSHLDGASEGEKRRRLPQAFGSGLEC